MTHGKNSYKNVNIKPFLHCNFATLTWCCKSLLHCG